MRSDERFKLIEEYGAYLTKNKEKYPTKEMVWMQEFIIESFKTFAKNKLINDEEKAFEM